MLSIIYVGVVSLQVVITWLMQVRTISFNKLPEKYNLARMVDLY